MAQSHDIAIPPSTGREPEDVPVFEAWGVTYWECRTGLCRPRRTVTKKGEECYLCALLSLNTPPKSRAQHSEEAAISPAKKRRGGREEEEGEEPPTLEELLQGGWRDVLPGPEVGETYIDGRLWTEVD